MNENLESEKIQIIKEAFEEKREIIGFAPPEMTPIDDQNSIEDVFITKGDVSHLVKENNKEN